MEGGRKDDDVNDDNDDDMGDADEFHAIADKRATFPVCTGFSRLYAQKWTEPE